MGNGLYPCGINPWSFKTLKNSGMKKLINSNEQIQETLFVSLVLALIVTVSVLFI
jgi:hypothetical protein